MAARENWIKAWTVSIHDPKILRLTWAERGVWMHCLLLSKSQSDNPSWYLVHDEPMNADDIALSLHAGTAEERRIVHHALARFVELGLMEHSDADGYHVLNWNKWQSGDAREDREKANQRQRKSRALRRKQATQATGTDGARPHNVRDLKPRGDD